MERKRGRDRERARDTIRVINGNCTKDAVRRVILDKYVIYTNIHI